MLFHTAKIEIAARHTGRFAAFPSEHVLFAVRNGAGKLRIAPCEPAAGAAQPEFCGALLLGNTPLVEVQSNGCPTCESLLAAGYGLPEDCGALREAQEALAQPYTGLDDALARLRPILGLLPTGVFILSHSTYAPTDGAGRFFWHAPDEFTAYPATAELYEPETYRSLPSFPSFLYPSQPVQKFDAARVAHNQKRLQTGEALPPALAYALWGYMSVLLDGHHRACACALEGERLPCLTISQPGRIWREGVPHLVWPDESETPIETLPPRLRKLLEYRVRDGEQTVELPPRRPAAGAFARVWPAAYAEAAARYPDCRETGTLARYPKIPLTREGLDFLIADEEYEDIAAAARLLTYTARRLGAQAKPLLLSYAVPGNCLAMRQAALSALCGIKDDPEIEALMIQVLVDIEQRDNPLYRIADGYWS